MITKYITKYNGNCNVCMYYEYQPLFFFQCMHAWCAELYCHPPRPQAADGGAASRYRG